MKVLFVSSYKNSGASNGLKRFSSLFLKKGIELEFFFLEDNWSCLEKKLIKISNSFCKRISRGDGIASSGFSFKNRALDEQIQKFDFVVLGWVSDGFWGLLPSLKGKNIVWRFSDSWPVSGLYHYKDAAAYQNRFERKLKSQKLKFIIENNVQVVCPSEFTFKQAILNGIPSSIVHNIITPIEDDCFDADGADLNTKSLENIIVSFGGVKYAADPRKGYDNMLGFTSALKDKSVFFYFFGDSSLMGNNEVNIQHLGLIDPMKRKEILSKSDYFFVPSLNDNLPQTGLEALAAGCRLVVSDNSGFGGLAEKLSQIRIVDANCSLSEQLANEVFEKLTENERYANIASAKSVLSVDVISQTQELEGLLKAIFNFDPS